MVMPSIERRTHGKTAQTLGPNHLANALNRIEKQENQKTPILGAFLYPQPRTLYPSPDYGCELKTTWLF